MFSWQIATPDSPLLRTGHFYNSLHDTQLLWDNGRVRILLVHNRYQNSGGEDFVFDAERALLVDAGEYVCTYERHNDEIKQYSTWDLADLVRRTVWATDSVSAISRILLSEKPDIAHFHNTFPLISPAAYSACTSAGVPVIQTLSNYRLICPRATLQREGKICELCIGKPVPWPGVLHRCYRGSRYQSAVVSAMLAFHRAARTWHQHVTTYVALTEFARRRLITGGLPEPKLVVKPNFVYPDPGRGSPGSGYALFVGRLSEEKGIKTLLRAWREIPGIPLKVAGDGPLRPAVEEAATDPASSRIEPVGWLSRPETLNLIRKATFLVLPSECYEGFPLTIVEAFACGIPVIGSRLGSVAEIIREDVSGLTFDPGDAMGLASSAKRLWEDSQLRARLGQGARAQYEAHYTAEKNYEMLMSIFENAIARNR